MKRALILLGAVILTFFSGCGDPEDRYRQITDTSSAESETSFLSNGAVKENFISGKLTYTNLNSENSVNEVKEILTGANIPSKNIDTVFDWVTDFNDAMKSCPAFTLVGDFTTIDRNTVDYGDYYLMSTEWYKKNKKDYGDILCRIAAFELNRENISVKNHISKENFNCWDENNSWLLSDGNIIFGEEASEGNKSYRPHPLLNWDDNTISDYFTLFDPVEISGGCGEQEMLRAVKERWNGLGISFGEEKYSLITLWTQYENTAAVSHAATLVETENGYLLFEKTNPESPYSAARFSTIDDVKRYLYDMLELDYSKYDSEVGTYIILQNDKQI
ncbi:MAG: DUF4300 family protein [Ruminococcaceae bacterium]|nr:DUF4300 family protein [Oscillospiraceae bacterium]